MPLQPRAQLDAGKRPTVPTPVQVTRALLFLMILGHLLTVASLQTQSAAGPSVGAWALHVSLAFLMAVFIWKLPTGHRWVRRPTTMSQVLSIGFSFLLWSSSINYRPLIPVQAIIGGIAVALLWIPHSSRQFFARNHSAPL